jgi:hypothetical protein
VSLRAACVVFPALLFLSSATASAGDYAVSYAFDTGDLIEAARTEKCEYRQECEINLEKTELKISLAFWHPDHNEVRVEISGQRLGCCYFTDGVESVDRDVRGTTIRLPVFEGRARKRNEFIQNIYVGVLHLRFSNTK